MDGDYDADQRGGAQDAEYANKVAGFEQYVHGLQGEGAGRYIMDIMSDPPLVVKDKQILERYAFCVMSAVAQIKDAEIDRIVQQMNEDQRDAMMKYVYRLLAKGENCNQLLKWHECLFKASGVGCVVRALFDRRSV